MIMETNNSEDILGSDESMENLSLIIFKNISDILQNASEKIKESELEKKTDNVISAEIWAARVLIYGVGGTVVASVGLVGNLISIIVLAQYRQKSSAPLLLILLALYDSLYLGSELMLETLTTLAAGDLLPKSYIKWITPAYVIFVHVPFIAQTGTMCMTVIITVERYIAVAKPFLAARVCKKSTALKGSLVVLIWSIIFRIPRYIAYTYYDEWQEETNSTKIIFNRTEFGNSNTYNDIYIIWLNLLFEFLLPCSILVVLNVLMLRALKKSKSLEGSKTRSKPRKDGNRLTAMVLAVTTIFFFCKLFSAISMILARGFNRFHECSLACNNFMSLSDTMVIVNSACNFILYCAVAKKFRDIFSRTFCRMSCRKKTKKKTSTGSSSGSHSTHITSLSHFKTHL